MPRKKNCDIIHEGRQSRPCVHCRLNERTDQYIHLVQKKKSAPEFYTFVKQIYLIEDEGCICRKCKQKLIRKYEQQTQNQDIQDEATPVKQQCVPHECPPKVDKAVKDFNLVVNDDRLRIVQHSATWLFTMLKSCLGPALVLHVAQSKKQGRMIYRLGTNLLQCLHSTISDHHQEIDELNNKMSDLEKKVNSNIASSSSLNIMECLDKTARLMKTHVKLYVKDAIKTQLPDIHCLDLYEEIKKINHIMELNLSVNI
ncbi:unnamed protein product [Mytilus coruscus]|uniref:Uncharacterized protein n=1 Tax=Mytilus coruscus TaxID=42192 RepID=A0A6J8E3C9_MYTCO|nr:unnamed protein product [Mytilus coruscus]